MKKSFLLLFTFYFFFTSTGVVFGTHMCGKKVSHTIWGINVSELGCKCTQNTDCKHKKKCCKDDVKWVKANTSSSKAEVAFQFNKVEFTADILFIVNWINKPFVKENLISYKTIHPPPLTSISLFLKNRILLI